MLKQKRDPTAADEDLQATTPQMQGARKTYIPECLHILCMTEIKQQPASQPSIPPPCCKTRG
jgi:hypothetical protein